MFGVSVIWGIAASVIKFTLQGISTVPFLTYRFGLAAIFGIFFILFKREKIYKNLKNFLELVLYGLLVSSVSLGLLFWGLEKTNVVEEALISAATPLITAIFGVILLREHVTKRERIGTIIAFFGTLFVILQPLLSNGLKEFHVFGNVLVFGYVIVTAVASIMAKRLLRNGISAITLTNFGFIAGFVSMSIFSYLTGQGLFPVSEVLNLELKYHLGVIYMALVSGTLGFFLWNAAQKTIEVGEAALFSYLLPIFSIPVAVIWLGEKITLPFMVGAAIIAIGVVIAEYKRPKIQSLSQ